MSNNQSNRKSSRKKKLGKRPDNQPFQPNESNSPGKLPVGNDSAAHQYLDAYQPPSPAEIPHDSLSDLPRHAPDLTTSTEGVRGHEGTVIYVHGIANKPPATVLRCQWDVALFGQSVGERSRMVYWVNRERHGEPTPGTCGDSDTADESASSLFQSGVGPRSFGERSAMESSKSFAADLVQEVLSLIHI